MNATLSMRQTRLVALLVLVVVAVGGYLVVTKNKATTQTTRTTASTTPAVTNHAMTTPTPSKTHSRPVTLHTHGLPVPVARALQKHSVVVVSVTNPQGADQNFTRSEAQAGANEMKAGYVNIDVFHQRPGTAILRKLGLVDTPEILVVKRSGVVAAQFKGFVDRDVVAQAVADAR
jgi:hypothetical protein